MAVEIIVGFDAHDIGIYGRARAAVPSLVTIAIVSGGQEDYYVVLGNDNNCDRGVEIQSCTCVCGLAVVRRQGRSLGERTRGKGRNQTRWTSDEIELFFDNCSFRDAILGNIRHVGT